MPLALQNRALRGAKGEKARREKGRKRGCSANGTQRKEGCVKTGQPIRELSELSRITRCKA